jgi:hypothetical protein
MRRPATFVVSLVLGVGNALAVNCSPGNLAATFSIDNSTPGTLFLTLTNTAACDVNDPPDILTAMFFNYNGAALTPVSAVVSPGSSQVFPSAPAGTYVGNEWRYGANLSVYGGTFDGIRAVGFGIPGGGQANFGCGGSCNNLQGMDFGILSAGDDTSTGNAPVTGGNTLIKNAVTFTFSYSGATPTLSNFSNVIFQYGTSLFPDEPCLGCTQFVPETGSAALLGAGMLLLAAGMILRRTRRA